MELADARYGCGCVRAGLGAWGLEGLQDLQDLISGM